MVKIFIFMVLLFTVLTKPAWAVNDPRLQSNNKVGIGTLNPEAEIEEVVKMVNNGGDWGWVLLVINKNERDLARWQKIFHLLSRYHLIPIIRIATEFNPAGYWQKPLADDAQNWAEFLSKLYWPVKNRYVQIYNEVNRQDEWGGLADPSEYAQELDKTINLLKAKSADFFILASPLDLALNSSGNSTDAAIFYKQMESALPGIFKKLDGWASHSYPNPKFTASPLQTGRLGISGYKWELSQVASFTDKKDLPVLITETGWRRDNNLIDGLAEDTISEYYKVAFDKVWTDGNLVAVTPFIFNNPDPLYHPFSFKTTDNNLDNKYYNYYQAIKDFPKMTGNPVRENLAGEITTNLNDLFVKNIEHKTSIKFKNIGQHVWNINKDIRINLYGQNLDTGNITWNKNEVYPGEDAIATLQVTALKEGLIPVKIVVSTGKIILTQREINILSTNYFSFILENFKKWLSNSGKLPFLAGNL